MSTAQSTARDPGVAAPAGGGQRRLGLALFVNVPAQLMVVVLGATIVNVALPHIQKALGFAGSGLEWVVTTTFPEGPPRNRALGVYAAMSVAGGAIGLLAGGLLTTSASWRWVLFVNVPIGAAVALAARRVLAETPRRRGRFDLPGAVTRTGGIAALVYGLSNAATSPSDVSHWGDAKVIASLAAAAVLLAAFAVIEARSRHALRLETPVRQGRPLVTGQPPPGKARCTISAAIPNG